MALLGENDSQGAVGAAQLGRRVMQRFLHFQNLARFVEALEHEPDPAKRDVLQQLLLEEENRFGDSRERSEQTDTLIARGRERIRQQRALVDRLGCDGKGVETAKIGLLNLLRTQSIFEGFRQVLVDGGADPPVI